MNRLVLWRRPIQTLYYFTLELIEIVIYYFLKFLSYTRVVVALVLICGLLTVGFYTEGAHLPALLHLRKKFLWSMYWMGLGIASSIGLGTGLHTFLLYLGPFIAEVTLAAYECQSLDFPEPPYPEEIMCPGNETVATSAVISILSIMSKVRLESIMWGAGTAIGELPPYFMARASALSSKENRALINGELNEELEEFEHLLKLEKEGTSQLSYGDRMRLFVFKMIKRVGFWGILLCASIPNPLFDLAGITCGYFMVNFWTFFGATLLGKAIIKMHMQKGLVIFLFSEHHLNNLLDVLSNVPFAGDKLKPLIEEWLNSEKNKLHMRSEEGGSGSAGRAPSESVLGWCLNKIVLAMILFFVVSIVNSLAQQRFKRLSTGGGSVAPFVFIDEPVKKKVAND
jgi:membrane protein YqaA with SNARE-associated domain